MRHMGRLKAAPRADERVSIDETETRCRVGRVGRHTAPPAESGGMFVAPPEQVASEVESVKSNRGTTP
jgi:hypothetical protein